MIGLFPVDGRPAPGRLPPCPGRISRPTRRPILIGSSLYAIRLLIECLPFSPISGPDEPDALAADGEANCQNAPAYPSEGEVARFGSTMRSIFGKHEARIIDTGFVVALVTRWNAWRTK